MLIPVKTKRIIIKITNNSCPLNGNVGIFNSASSKAFLSIYFFDIFQAEETPNEYVFKTKKINKTIPTILKTACQMLFYI